MEKPVKILLKNSKAELLFETEHTESVYNCARISYKNHRQEIIYLSYIHKRCIPLGMVDHFRERMKRKFKIETEVINARTERIDYRKLMMTTDKVAMEHQENIEAGTDEFPVGKVSSPTGSGKTFITSLIVNQKQTTTLIITPTELAQMNAYEELSSCFGKKNVSIDVPQRPPEVGRELKRRSTAVSEDQTEEQPELSSYEIWLQKKQQKKDKPKKGTPEHRKWSIDKARERQLERFVEKNWEKPIHIICAASIPNLPYWYIEKINLLIIDESHGAYAKLTRNLILASNPTYLYGLSATNWRDQAQEDRILNALFNNKMIYEFPIDEAIEKGIHAKVSLQSLNSPAPEKFYIKRDINVGGKTVTISERLMNSRDPRTIIDEGIIRNRDRNKMIVEWAYRDATEGHMVFIAIDEIGQYRGKDDDEDKSYCLKHFLDMRTDIPVFFISGELSLKQKMAELKKIATSETPYIVVGTMSFGIAVDVPGIDTVYLGSWGKSSIRAIQRAGRGARTQMKEKTLRLFNIWDWWNKSAKKQSKIRIKTLCSYYGVDCTF
ncbi:DEAD/DEAH box helicase [Bdellovibrio sp. BCCA]|uniref:DEAD/DEAH box helicase n=1 Tax=Bdellovibrio sp. BCCA TaxID=3136281 RepID=UPI0030F2F495